jgi:hypothetical protein
LVIRSGLQQIQIQQRQAVDFLKPAKTQVLGGRRPWFMNCKRIEPVPRASRKVHIPDFVDSTYFRCT